MPNFEKLPEENRVQDISAAREAAEAENPARSYLIKNREKLSPEQQKALEWFATSEGEGAVADFEKAKENQKNIVRERAFNLLRIDPETAYPDKIARLFEGEKVFTGTAYKDEKERVLKEMNDELIPVLFKEKIDGILATKKDLAGKLGEVGETRQAFINGVYRIVEYKEIPGALQEEFNVKNKESFFYGLLAPCLVKKIWVKVAEALDFGDRTFGVDFDGLVRRLGDRLSEGHSSEDFNKEMERHNYIFNPKTNRYEKVE